MSSTKSIDYSLVSYFRNKLKDLYPFNSTGSNISSNYNRLCVILKQAIDSHCPLDQIDVERILYVILFFNDIEFVRLLLVHNALGNNGKEKVDNNYCKTITSNGYNKDGYNKERYNKYGCNKDGYNKERNNIIYLDDEQSRYNPLKSIHSLKMAKLLHQYGMNFLKMDTILGSVIDFNIIHKDHAELIYFYYSIGVTLNLVEGYFITDLLNMFFYYLDYICGIDYIDNDYDNYIYERYHLSDISSSYRNNYYRYNDDNKHKYGNMYDYYRYDYDNNYRGDYKHDYVYCYRNNYYNYKHGAYKRRRVIINNYKSSKPRVTNLHPIKSKSDMVNSHLIKPNSEIIDSRNIKVKINDLYHTRPKIIGALPSDLKRIIFYYWCTDDYSKCIKSCSIDEYNWFALNNVNIKLPEARLIAIYKIYSSYILVKDIKLDKNFNRFIKLILD